MEKIDFDEISRSVSNEWSENCGKLKDYTVTSAIISSEDFYNLFNSKALEKTSKIPAIGDVSIDDFASIFKSFEDYPENLAKPKKIQCKDTGRINSTILKNSTTITTETTTLHAEDSIQTPQALPSFGELDEQETAARIYKKYEQFKLNLSKLIERQQRLATLTVDYTKKLQQINIFAQQLEKLLPSQHMKKQAFNKEEDMQLQTIVADIKNLCYLQSNQDVFNSTNGINLTNGSNSQRLEELLEVLAHSLISISCYNEI